MKTLVLVSVLIICIALDLELVVATSMRLNADEIKRSHLKDKKDDLNVEHIGDNANDAVVDSDNSPGSVKDVNDKLMDRIKDDGDKRHPKTDPTRSNGKTKNMETRRPGHQKKGRQLDKQNIKNKNKNVKDVLDLKINENKTADDLSNEDKDKECGADCEPKMTEADNRLEMIKAQLLQKIGLSEPPKVEGTIHPLPFDFYIGENFAISDEPEDDENEDHTITTRQIFVFGQDETNLCLKKKGAGCYSFNLTDRGINLEDVGHVDLWIYKQADPNDRHIQTFVVSELSRHHKHGMDYLRSRSLVKRFETRLKYGWMKIYVNRMVLRWLSKPKRNNGLAVVCKTCKRQGHKTIFGDKEGRMPFLVFTMNQRGNTRQRNKRETRCLEGGNNCCHREPLEINFHDIGWDFIMAPPSIRPNYCTGSCNGIHAAYYNHTRLLQTLQQSVSHDYIPLQPCCSPVHFRRAQSLLYRDHQNVVRKVDIPDLIVGGCGCT